jgi:hypothetical protein
MRILSIFIVSSLITVLAGAQGLTKEQYRRAMEKALGEVGQRATAAGGTSRVKVGANLFFAHEAFIEKMPTEVLLKAVDAFADAGIYRVDMNVGLWPWVDNDKSQIAKYDAAVDRVRSRGMQLALNPQYSPYKHKVANLKEYQEKVLPVLGDLAARYRPETMVVVHEPSTMNDRMRSKASPDEWRDFVRAAARLVKEKSPRTRVGAGALFQEAAYFNAFAGLPEVDVLTIDIYRIVGLKEAAEMARRAKEQGKVVYIEETWRPPYYSGRATGTLDQIASKSVGDRTFESLDIQWIQSMARFADALGMEAITPVWMQAFFKYEDGPGDALDPGYNKQVAEAIMRGERTKTYEAVRALTGKARQ